jgi:hypothetical protein
LVADAGLRYEVDFLGAEHLGDIGIGEAHPVDAVLD